MPIYDYRCDHCGHAFSAVQSFKDEQLATCPSCGKRPRRLIAPPAIVFKGSGWYKTDSRTSRAGPKEAKDKEAKDKDSTSGAAESASTTATPAKSDKASSPTGGG